jgi:hypothetical protein
VPDPRATVVAFFNENATINTTIGSLLEVVARNLSELKPWYSEEGDRFRFPGRGKFTDQAREETVGSRRVRCCVRQEEEKSWATGSCPLFSFFFLNRGGVIAFYVP